MAGNPAAFARLTAMMTTQPTQRPAEYANNPLEKIEELLTCPICLERYKQPKLLPCQHTFCAEPCLEGCEDIVKRTIKCPECRAEHSLPYDGVKGFQTNFTLLRFLDVHLQASEENAGDLDAYVRRYNMERCKVCDEKAIVSICVHCDKSVCEDCKASHMTMVKRDLSRLMLQVKRLSNRITEASDGLSKGMESLTVNCTFTKDEMKEYIRRYVKELKKKEDHLAEEVDTFYAAETRLMRNLRDALELESSNISEACAKLEAFLKGETQFTDSDIVFYKTLFTEGLDYLRGFHPDADDLFGKKLRFSLGGDVNAMPTAILQFGEIQVCSAQFGGRWAQLEKTYMPKSFGIGNESDRIKANQRGGPDSTPATDRESAWASRNGAAPNFNAHVKMDEDPGNIRYRRRQELEQEAWQRLQPGTSNGRRATAARTVDKPPATPVQKAVQKSPFVNVTPGVAKPPVQKTPNAVQQGARVDALPPRPPPTATASATNSPSLSSSNSGTDLVEEVVRQVQPPGGPLVRSKPTLVHQQTDSVDDASLNEKVENIRREHDDRRRLGAPLTSGSSANTETQHPRATAVRAHFTVSSPVRHTVPVDEESSEEEEDPDTIPITVTHYAGSPRSSMQPSRSSPPTSIDHAKARRATQIDPADVAGAYNWKKYLIPEPVDAVLPHNNEDEFMLASRQLFSARSRTNPELIVTRQGARLNPGIDDAALRRTRYADRLEKSGSGENNSDSSHKETINRSREERKQRIRRKAENSKNSTETSGQPSTTPTSAPMSVGRPAFDYGSKGTVVGTFGVKGAGDGEFNWPRGITVLNETKEVAICDSSNHRIQIFTTTGAFVRQIGKYGNNPGEFDCLAGIACGKHGQLIVTDRYNHRVQVLDSRSGRVLRHFGAHGASNGRLNNPWGVAQDAQGFIYVCDKDNHRVQVFQADGQFVSKFGGMGSRDGQMTNPHFIAVNRGGDLIVSDTGNHRIQIFDHSGHFKLTFGSEGFTNGQFKYPRGVAVDDKGFILVADSGNNRVQIFDGEGRFHTSLGTWGCANGQMKGVEDVALTSEGRLLVTDRENHRVQIF